MHFYKTLPTEAGLALRDSLAKLRTEGEACEQASLDFARDLGAESYVPAVGSDYGGIAALCYAPSNAHIILFGDKKNLLRPVFGDNNQPILSDNGTPYMVLNCKFDEHPERYTKAQRMRHRSDVILSQGKLSLAAVINMMSRTEIIKEGLGRKPKFSNEYQILKFRYQHARSAAHEKGRDAEKEWLNAYAKLVTAQDFRQMFPDITAGEAQQLEKSRAELQQAIDALADTEWSIVIRIVPGEGCTDVTRLYELARRQYFLPVITFGDTHRLLGATPQPKNTARPATFELDGVCYIQIIEEATAEGLASIEAEEYQKALEKLKVES